MSIAVELSGITKSFPGVIANDDVNLVVKQGEIHAICGENGAGKSTLMKILYGMIQPDSGEMRVNGETVDFSSPVEAIKSGIGMVHQHFMLADQLSVLENVILGSEPIKQGGKLDFKKARKHLQVVSKAYGLTVEPNDLVETLEVGERQRVEIIKVLYRGANILILDEPTAVLVPQEVEELFRNIKELQENGTTIIFIDHKLNEVLEIADTITVLRSGKTVASMNAEEVTAAELAELMVGSELPSPSIDEPVNSSSLSLEIENLTIVGDDERKVVDDVSIKVHKGEIVGIAGVEGNGQHELVGSILGTQEVATGRILLNGSDITQTDVRFRRENGLGYIPQDRQHEGLLLTAPLWENAALGYQTQDPFASGLYNLFFNRKGSRAKTSKICSEFDVRTPNIEVAAHALSGGNQQKLLVGKELLSDPTVLIASHPTRGIDVGAQAAIWEQIKSARSNGLATLLISADLDELIGLSDVIVVMFRGKIVAKLDPNNISPRDLGGYMTGSSVQEQRT